MLRVLHVVPSYLPARRYGGPIVAVHALCAALARRGCDVSVYTTSVDGPGDSDVPHGVPVVQDGVAVHYFRSPYLRRLYYSPPMARALRDIAGRFDVLHLHSVFLWPTWAAARAARAARIPYLLAPRGMLVDDLIARKNAWVKRAWIRLVESRNLAGAAAVHVTSALEKEELGRLGLRLGPTLEIPNGVESGPEEDTPEALPAEAARAWDSGRPVILFLGRIHWKKGLDRLLDALALVPDAVLLVVGNDEDDYGSRLRMRWSDPALAGRVFITGPAFGAQKRALYRRAALFALASYSENFGNTVLEAMAEGCPVVVTPEVGAAAIVAEARAGIVAPGEAGPFSAALRTLIADPGLRATMGANGRSCVRQRYSWDQVAARTVDAYRQALAGRERKDGDAA